MSVLCPDLPLDSKKGKDEASGVLRDPCCDFVHEQEDRESLMEFSVGEAISDFTI